MPSLISGETLRILLVSHDSDMRDVVTDALSGRIGDYRLYWVAQPDLAESRAEDLLPHVVIVDDALEGVPVAAAVKQLVARAPAALMLVMVEGNAISAARDSMLAGARGFITKPLQPEDLVASLHQVLAQRIVPLKAPDIPYDTPKGRIVVFCAPKGGTGRTTLAINTSICLCQEINGPVALVDADYTAPALDVALNLQGQRSIVDLLPRIARLDPDLIDGIMVPHASGIRVLLAPPPADLSQRISLPQVQQIMVHLRRMFPWVLVDLGLPMDEMAFAFLDGADRIVMSVLPEMVGLRNTRLMLDLLNERGYPRERIWLVLNRATMPSGVPADDIEDRLRLQIKHKIPDDQPLVTNSVNRGVPLSMSHNRSALARAFRSLAQQLLTDMPQETAPGAVQSAESRKLLSRFRGRQRTVSVAT